MAKRLFSYAEENLRQASEMGEILTQNNIEFYETPASRWGFSKATIWIKNNNDFAKARQLFEQHVQDFALRARQAYQEETGYDPNASLGDRLRFYFQFFGQRKSAILLVIFGIGLIVFTYYIFFALLLN